MRAGAAGRAARTWSLGPFKPDLPAELEHLLQTIEVIPLKKIGNGEAMDVEAILRRRPQVCLVDGVAYNNPPGSKNPQRWQDVEELLAAGIIVITSLNLQHIEERREAVERITGKHVTETVPERFLYNANEIVIVDVPPELLLERAGQPSTTAPALAERRGGFPPCGRSPCCLPPKWLTASLRTTFSLTASSSFGARRNASWFA